VQNQPAVSYLSAEQILESARRFSHSLDSILQTIVRSFANTLKVVATAYIFVAWQPFDTVWDSVNSNVDDRTGVSIQAKRKSYPLNKKQHGKSTAV